MAAPIIVTIKIAPWFRFYIEGLDLCCWLTDCEPNLVRVEYWLCKASSITINSNKSNK
jgi:hypothetical protein